MAEQAPNKLPQSEIEREAIEALSREFRPSLVRYFSKRCKETTEIEDLVQEVFLRLVKRSVVTDVKQVGGYVFQTASSVLTDWLRRRTVRHVNDHEEFVPEAHGSVDFSPERVLIGKDRLAEAVAILMELPERPRTVFVLRRIEGLRYKDIAARLGISVSAIERHMKRAVLHLMKRLEDE